MPSTSAPISGLIAGYSEMGGLQLGNYGAILTQLKAYNFGVTDTRQISSSSTAGSYTVSGLTTNDVPIALTPSTGAAALGIAQLFVSATNTLEVGWSANGTSTSGTPGLSAPGKAYTLFTLSYYAQSNSTTT